VTILEMSLGGAVLIAVTLVLRRALLYRMPKWTFLLLWAVALGRLLIPFTLPSQFSVYTGVARAVQLFEEETPVMPSETRPSAAASGTFREDGWTASAASALTPEKKPAAPVTTVYLTGTALCGLFFAVAYLWGLRRFSEAEPVKSDFLFTWQAEHPTLLPVEIKSCAAVNAPLAYGLLRPVVLLPENTDWSDEDQLTCVLTHEYVHIRRGDLGWKLLLTAALCIHWFNPLVWAMYFQANRDLELACDEAVVRILGLDNRKRYAYSLLSAAVSGFSPHYITFTTKNHMEERIRAVMKMKRTSVVAVLTAALLVTGVTAVFATAKAPEPENIDSLPQAVQSTPLPQPAPAPALAEKNDPVPDTSASVTAPRPNPAPIPVEKNSPVPDASASVTAPQPTSTQAPEPIAEPVEPTAEPVKDTPQIQSQEPVQNATSVPALVDRWGVPADPIPEGTEIPVANHAEADALIEYLHQARGIGAGDVGYINYHDGRVSVSIHYMQTNTAKRIKDRLPDGVYPVNSKGETYGTAMDSEVVGYDPDLVLVQAMNGKSGYAFKRDLSYGGYPGEINNPDDAMAYMEWLKAQPSTILIPVYDVDRDNIIGYFGLSNSSDMTPEEELETIAEDAEIGQQRGEDS